MRSQPGRGCPVAEHRVEGGGEGGRHRAGRGGASIAAPALLPEQWCVNRSHPHPANAARCAATAARRRRPGAPAARCAVRQGPVSDERRAVRAACEPPKALPLLPPAPPPAPPACCTRLPRPLFLTLHPCCRSWRCRCKPTAIALRPSRPCSPLSAPHPPCSPLSAPLAPAPPLAGPQQDMILVNVEPFKNLIPSFTSILKQVGSQPPAERATQPPTTSAANPAPNCACP